MDGHPEEGEEGRKRIMRIANVHYFIYLITSASFLLFHKFVHFCVQNLLVHNLSHLSVGVMLWKRVVE